MIDPSGRPFPLDPPPRPPTALLCVACALASLCAIWAGLALWIVLLQLGYYGGYGGSPFVACSSSFASAVICLWKIGTAVADCRKLRRQYLRIVGLVSGRRA